MTRGRLGSAVTAGPMASLPSIWSRPFAGVAVPSRPAAEILQGLGLKALLALGLWSAWPVAAQTTRQPQPEAITPSTLAAPPCPRIVPPQQWVLQPLRIQASQVALKNRMGCLSAADAIYGPDGCPRVMCTTAESNRVPLPKPSPSSGQ